MKGPAGHRRRAALPVAAALATLGMAGAGLPPGLPGQTGRAGAAGHIGYEAFSLPNGLRVIYAVDRAAPIVTVDVWYAVGARNERPGHAGFAHLFEHLMFQGSAHVRKSEHFQLIERAGGTLNGSTHDDYTNYYETVPSNRLNLALWLEADRMRSLAVTQQNLDNQRETVKEEKRLRVDNQPYAATFGDGTTWPFDSAGCFAYAHTAIGSVPDLDAARLADVQAFFDSYYAPNNATLVVVGDVKRAELRRLVNAYFADIPSHAAPPAVRCTWSLAPGTIRRAVEDAHATLPAVMRFYRLAPHDHADTPALQLLSVILGQGESARLNVTVVRRERAALQAGLFGLDERRGPAVLVAYGIANQNVPVERLDSLIATQLDSVRRTGVTADELARAKNTYRADFVHTRETTFGRAEALAHYTLFHARTADINTDLERYLAVTAADVQRVAARYLDPANAVIAIVRPTATAERPGVKR